MSCSPLRTRRVRKCLSALLCGCAGVIAGCEAWRGANIDHPVLGPPPPRLSYVDAEQIPPESAVMTADASDSGSGEPPGIMQVGLSETEALPDHFVVATVNGEPVLAGEVLAGYQGYIARFRGRGVPESQIRRLQEQLIEKHLEDQIQQTLLVQKLRLMLKKEQLEKMETQLNLAFNEYLQGVMQQMGVTSKVELERTMAENGESLAAREQAFKKNQLAQLYLFEQVGAMNKVFGRPEVLAYYQAHPDEFSQSAKARFQLLEVDFKKHGGREAARARLDEALAALSSGTPFPEVAEQYSDDAQAKRGGQWDWLKPGDFANATVNELLFSLPIDQTSDVIEGRGSFMVIRVTEREEAGLTPLADVQSKILAKLQQEHRKQASDQLFSEMMESAVITKHLELGEARS